MSLYDSKPKTKAVDDDIIDIDLSVTKKKKFRINGEDDKILELNTSDMNILVRLKETYPKLNKLSEKAASLQTDEASDNEEDELNKIADELKEIDTTMKESIDYIFDSNVSELCCENGSMYDPFNGKFRFEHIIETLVGLYETNISLEYQRMSNRVKKHTDKYTGKK